MSDNLDELSKLLLCPDCSNSLKSMESDGSIVAFLCSRCEIVFPIKDNIPILLARPARNFSLEYPLILALSKDCSLRNDARDAISNTRNILLNLEDCPPSWEWEDEVFWSAEYRLRRANQIEKNWNDRNWERELLSTELLKRISLKGRTILSIGAGEGSNFKHLFLPHCDEKTLYIAIDISFEALISNRLSNPHRNSLFILASADYGIPIRNKAVDILCYFGILHHTKNKIDNIQRHLVLVPDGGFVLLAEALFRPQLPISKIIEQREEKSAHEGHLTMSAVTTTLSKVNILETIILYEFGTVLLTAVKYAFGGLLLWNRRLYQSFLRFDMYVSSKIGSHIEFLKGGSILLLAKVVRELHT